jgi:hypothetical protein
MWWRRWFLATTAGEFLGFAGPAVLGAFAFDLPLPAETAVLVAAGCVEGAVLGLAQGLVMHRAHPAISVARWSAATAVGGGAAWLTAMGGVALIQSTVGDVLRVAALAVLGVVLLLTIGVAQWWLLRAVAPAAWRWIPATAAAWIAGLLVFTGVTTPLWQPGQPVGLIVAIGVLGGLVMAATMAAVTGWAFVRVANPALPPGRDGRPAWAGTIDPAPAGGRERR